MTFHHYSYFYAWLMLKPILESYETENNMKDDDDHHHHRRRPFKTFFNSIQARNYQHMGG